MGHSGECSGLWSLVDRFHGGRSPSLSSGGRDSLATIDFIVADGCFIDEFVVIGGKQKPGALSPSPGSPATASVATDKDGKELWTPFEWLAPYDLSFVTARWHCSLRGNFYCRVCISTEKHHPNKCMFLGKLGLKLINSSGTGCSGMSGALLGSPLLADASTGSKPGAPVPPAAMPAAVVPPPISGNGIPFCHRPWYWWERYPSQMVPFAKSWLLEKAMTEAHHSILQPFKLVMATRSKYVYMPRSMGNSYAEYPPPH